MADPIERVFVAGAGLMGHGIAQVHAAIGSFVVLDERTSPGRPPDASGSPGIRVPWPEAD